MSNLRDFFHSLKAVSAVRPEQKAIPSTLHKPLLRELASKEGREYTSGLRMATQRRGVESRLGEVRHDIRLAKRDAPIATAIEAGNVLMSIREEKEREKRQAETEALNKKYMGEWENIKMLFETYPDEIKRILEGESIDEVSEVMAQ